MALFKKIKSIFLEEKTIYPEAKTYELLEDCTKLIEKIEEQLLMNANISWGHTTTMVLYPQRRKKVIELIDTTIKNFDTIKNNIGEISDFAKKLKEGFINKNKTLNYIENIENPVKETIGILNEAKNFILKIEFIRGYGDESETRSKVYFFNNAFYKIKEMKSEISKFIKIIANIR